MSPVRFWCSGCATYTWAINIHEAIIQPHIDWHPFWLVCPLQNLMAETQACSAGELQATAIVLVYLCCLSNSLCVLGRGLSTGEPLSSNLNSHPVTEPWAGKVPKGEGWCGRGWGGQMERCPPHGSVLWSFRPDHTAPERSSLSSCFLYVFYNDSVIHLVSEPFCSMTSGRVYQLAW